MNKNNNKNNRKRRFLVKTPLKYIHSEKCQQKACKKALHLESLTSEWIALSGLHLHLLN